MADVPNADPKVYISVLNWNNWQDTVRCLTSLQILEYSNLEIIVVDNASGNDSVSQIRAAFPDLPLIRSDSNLGYAGGNELALQCVLEKETGTALFWILNNDAVVRPDTLSALIDAYRTHGEALYGSVPVIRASTTGEWVVRLRLWELRQGTAADRRFHGIPFRQAFPTTEPRRVVTLGGSSLAIPLAIVRKHGFMDGSFFMYAEEADYCFRLHKSGVCLYLVPDSVFFHEGGASHSDSELRAVMRYYQVRNRLVFYRRHLGFWPYLGGTIRALSDALGQGAWGTVSRKRAAATRACFKLEGVRDALFNRMGKRYSPEDWIE